jgi:hypothetical protein
LLDGASITRPTIAAADDGAATALRPLVDVFFFATYMSLNWGLLGLVDCGPAAPAVWERATTWNPMLRRRRPAVNMVYALGASR